MNKRVILAGLLLLAGANTAFASLIGTTVDVSYVNDGNPAGNASTSVIVQAGSADAFQFGFLGAFGFTIDIDDTSISLLCTGISCNDTPDLGPAHYIFEGLDWGGSATLSSVAIDAASSCPLCSASVNLLSPTSFELLFADNANPALNDTLLVNLEPTPVPEPSVLVLLGAGLAALGFMQRRRVA